MKKRILLFCLLMISIICIFAISVSAAETKTVDGVTYYLYKSGSNYYCEATNANKSCTLETVIIPETITGSDGNAYTFVQVNQDAFNGNKNIKYVSLPATLKTIKPTAFRDCTSLEYVEFNNNQNDVDFNNWGHFYGCKSLKAFAFPQNTTVVTNRILSGCTSLQAVCLPSAAVKIGSNGGGQGPFCGNTQMYFVSEYFSVVDENGNFYGDKFEMPSKPTVYEMPESLTTVIGHVRKEFGGNGGSVAGSIFQNCKNLNEVIVFGSGFNYIGSHNLFNGMGSQESPKTVVFKGDIKGAVTLQNAQYVSFVFTNSADKSLADIGLVNVLKNSNNTDSYMYFCAEEAKYNYHTSSSEISDAAQIAEYVASLEKITEAKHVYVVKVSTLPTCTENGVNGYKCFCGNESEDAEFVDALGHQKSVLVEIKYNGAALYFEKGDTTYYCERCESEHTVENEAEALFAAVGYSHTVEGNPTKAIMQSFGVNHKAIAKYNEYTQNDILDFGVFAATENGLGENTDVFGDDGITSVAKVNVASYKTKSFDLIEMKLGGLEGKGDVSYEDAKLYCCAYVQVANGEKIESYYATKGASGALVGTSLSNAVSYNDLTK